MGHVLVGGVDVEHARAEHQAEARLAARLERGEFEGVIRLVGQRGLRTRGEAVSRDEMLSRAWAPDEFPTERTIDNFILRLRKRFERDPESPVHFLTVRGVGYRFERRTP